MAERKAAEFGVYAFEGDKLIVATRFRARPLQTPVSAGGIVGGPRRRCGSRGSRGRGGRGGAEVAAVAAMLCRRSSGATGGLHRRAGLRRHAGSAEKAVVDAAGKPVKEQDQSRGPDGSRDVALSEKSSPSARAASLAADLNAMQGLWKVVRVERGKAASTTSNGLPLTAEGTNAFIGDPGNSAGRPHISFFRPDSWQENAVAFSYWVGATGSAKTIELIDDLAQSAAAADRTDLAAGEFLRSMAIGSDFA